MDEQLVELFIQKKTMSQIALELGVRKGQASGRLHRIRRKPPSYIKLEQQVLIAPNNLTDAQIAEKNMRYEPHKRPEALEGFSISTTAASLAMLPNDRCSWPMEDGRCCGKPVVSVGALEGDRRRTHCQHHYDVSTGVIDG